MPTIDFAEVIRRRLAERGQSQYRAALNGGLPQDAIRFRLERARPPPQPRRADLPRRRFGALHRSVTGRSGRGRQRRTVPPADPFRLERPTAVRVLLPPSPDVYLMKSEEADQTRPAPADLDDPQAFYVLLHGHSMVPTGIGPADFCLVSPCAKLEPGQRIWLRDRKGREGLRWLIRMMATTYEGGRLAAAEAERPPGPGRRAVGAQGRRRPRRHSGGVPRLARFRRTRRAGSPTGDPGRLTGLWRALFDGQPELEAAVAEHLEQKTSSFNRRITGWLEYGSVQRSDMEDLLQQVEGVKQLAQLLSLRSDASRNESGAPGERLTDPPAGAGATRGR